MKRQARYFLVLLLTIFFSGCAKSRPIKLPPIVEGWHKAAATKNAYIVQPKDTLYSIAWAFGIDYHDLAAINHLQAPYVLRRGQRLYITAPSFKHKTSAAHYKLSTLSTKPLFGWGWPTTGKIIAKFDKKLGGNKGVDIAGSSNQPILACHHGTVVYSGTGLRSYGKLIIIKHNDEYLSAYAYNRQLLVAEGEEVKTGQKIATMGQDNEGREILHFEIRRFGKPTDPLLYLPKRP